MLICHPKHPLAKEKNLRLSHLEGQKFIAFESDIPTRKAIDKILRDSGVARDPKVRTALERDFATYLRARGHARPQPSATTSFWRTYDVLVGPIGRQAAKGLVERLFSASEEGPR